MPINTSPTFGRNPIHWQAELNSQVLGPGGGSIGPTSPVLLGVAGNYGAVLPSIMVQATGTIATANILHIFTLADGDTEVHLILNLALPTAASAAALAANYPVSVALPPTIAYYSGATLLEVAPNESLYVALNAAEPTNSFVINAWGKDYDATEL
jgi:hypothetical protein